MGPAGGMDCTPCKNRPVACLVGQLDPFVICGKGDGVVADNIAAAQAGKANVAFLARAGNTVAAPVGHLIE